MIAVTPCSLERDVMTTPPTIGKYEVVERLRHGGMGTLYLGRDPDLDRSVAIKVIRADIDSAAVRVLFEREARAVARLRHPNIVTVFDYGQFQGQPYLVMEYIEGESLRELIAREHPLPTAEKMRLMDEICAGVGRAHHAQLVHRDLKPENIMIDRENHVAKILDFGIARSLETQRAFTHGIGTLSYMAPEQLRTGEVDVRTDIFALGAIFYELLSYRQAFPGATEAIVLRKILDESPVPLAELDPSLDPALVQIVTWALAKAPADRYQNIDALRSDLQRGIAAAPPVIPASYPSRQRPEPHAAFRSFAGTSHGAISLAAVLMAISLALVISERRGEFSAAQSGAGAIRRGDTVPGVDLLGTFPLGVAKLPGLGAFTLLDVRIAGEMKKGILVGGRDFALTRLTWQLTIPASASLRVSLGILEEGWTTPGDGVLFKIGIGVSSAGRYDELLSLVRNPSGNPADRGWHTVDLDLTEYAGRTVEVIFTTQSSVRPADNRSGDYPVWGEPRLRLGVRPGS
jgi:serine/threonine protein kinase